MTTMATAAIGQKADPVAPPLFAMNGQAADVAAAEGLCSVDRENLSAAASAPPLVDEVHPEPACPGGDDAPPALSPEIDEVDEVHREDEDLPFDDGLTEGQRWLVERAVEILKPLTDVLALALVVPCAAEEYLKLLDVHVQAAVERLTRAPAPVKAPRPKAAPSRKARKPRKSAKKGGDYGSRKRAIVAKAQAFSCFTCAMVTKALKEKGTYVWNTLHELVTKRTEIKGQVLIVDPDTHEYVWVAPERD
jgi:hypothetical protein